MSTPTRRERIEPDYDRDRPSRREDSGGGRWRRRERDRDRDRDRARDREDSGGRRRSRDVRDRDRESRDRRRRRSASRSRERRRGSSRDGGRQSDRNRDESATATAIDPWDGKRKTKSEFKRAYGDFVEWDKARVGVQGDELNITDWSQYAKDGAPSGKLRGVVMMWMDDKGIGYIHGPGNPPGAGGLAPPIFIHRCQLPNSSQDALEEGKTIFYELLPDQDRPGFNRACRVCGPALKLAGRGLLREGQKPLPEKGSLGGKAVEGPLAWGRKR